MCNCPNSSENERTKEQITPRQSLEPSPQEQGQRSSRQESCKTRRTLTYEDETLPSGGCCCKADAIPLPPPPPPELAGLTRCELAGVAIVRRRIDFDKSPNGKDEKSHEVTKSNGNKDKEEGEKDKDKEGESDKKKEGEKDKDKKGESDKKEEGKKDKDKDKEGESDKKEEGESDKKKEGDETKKENGAESAAAAAPEGTPAKEKPAGDEGDEGAADAVATPCPGQRDPKNEACTCPPVQKT